MNSKDKELEMLEKFPTNLDTIGTLSSNYSLESEGSKDISRLMSKSNAAASISFMSSLSFSVVINISAFFLVGQLGLLGIGGYFMSQHMTKSGNIRMIIKDIQKHPLVNSKVTYVKEAREMRFIDSSGKSIRKYGLLLDNGKVVELTVAWTRIGIGANKYSFKVFGPHVVNKQLDVWDDTFESVKAMD